MIELQDVTRIYQTGKISLAALNGVSLRIEEGELATICGPSGSGKTTLLNILGAMDKPTSGKVIINNEDITNCTNRQLTDFRAEKIGFIFQNFHLIPALNVIENITIPLKLKGEKYQKKNIMELIEKVGLDKHIRHKPDELSGGQKQRVAIARALAHHPPCILADEPTANLDSKTAQNIINLLQELNKSLRVTVIFASHDPYIIDIIKKKFVLKDGRLDDDN